MPSEQYKQSDISAGGMVSRMVMENIQAAIFLIGNAPEPIIYDGNHLWIGNVLWHTVMKINLQGEREAVYDSHARKPNATSI